MKWNLFLYYCLHGLLLQMRTICHSITTIEQFRRSKMVLIWSKIWNFLFSVFSKWRNDVPIVINDETLIENKPFRWQSKAIQQNNDVASKDNEADISPRSCLTPGYTGSLCEFRTFLVFRRHLRLPFAAICEMINTRVPENIPPDGTLVSMQNSEMIFYRLRLSSSMNSFVYRQ